MKRLSIYVKFTQSTSEATTTEFGSFEANYFKNKNTIKLISKRRQYFLPIPHKLFYFHSVVSAIFIMVAFDVIDILDVSEPNFTGTKIFLHVLSNRTSSA